MKRYSVFPIFRIGFRFFLFFVLFFSIVSCKNSQINRRIELSEWKFTYEDKEYSAQIPGCIHTDLLNNQLIEDPFFGNREDSLQWIGERMWVYTTTFDKSQIDGFNHVELVFDGIDTHADIFLNGEPLMHVEGGNHVNNMFRQWRFPLPDNLKDGKNFLEVKFLPAPEYERAQAEKLPYKLPEERAFSRKAPYQSGWDWGPKFVTCGMWQPVYFDCWNNIKVGDFQIVQSLLNTDSAVVQLPFTIQSDRPVEPEESPEESTTLPEETTTKTPVKWDKYNPENELAGENWALTLISKKYPLGKTYSPTLAPVTENSSITATL